MPDGGGRASCYTRSHPTPDFGGPLLSNSVRQLLLILCLLPVLALGVVACGDGGDGQDEPFRIGVMESLTGAGETYGTVANQSKQMAADEINAAGGIDGRRLEFVVEDSKCNAAGRHRRLPQAHRRGRCEDHPWHLVQQPPCLALRRWRRPTG